MERGRQYWARSMSRRTAEWYRLLCLSKERRDDRVERKSSRKRYTIRVSTFNATRVGATARLWRGGECHVMQVAVFATGLFATFLFTTCHPLTPFELYSCCTDTMHRKLGCERELRNERVDGIAVEFESICNNNPTACSKVAHLHHLPLDIKNMFFPVFAPSKTSGAGFEPTHP